MTRRGKVRRKSAPAGAALRERTRKGMVASAHPAESKLAEVTRPWFEVVALGAAPGSLDDKTLRLTRRILFLARRWRNLLDQALRATGDSHARWVTLLWVDLLAGRANLGELAEQVAVELPTLVRLLDNLEREGLVERRALRSSNRAKTVVLTARARPVLDAMTAVVARTRAEFLRDVDERRLDAALELLDEVMAKYVRVVSWPGHPD